MAAAIPTITVGTVTFPTAQIITLGVPRRQMLIENLDTVDSVTVAWNGSVGAWTLLPGSRLGVLLNGGITTITVTPVGGAPSFQVLFQG